MGQPTTIRETQAALRLLRWMTPLLEVGIKRAPGVRSTLTASRPPVSIDWLLLRDIRWPQQYTNPTTLPVVDRPFGVAPTLGIWATHIDMERLDAGDISEPVLDECPSLDDSIDYLVDTAEWYAEHDDEGFSRLVRTVYYITSDAARLVGEQSEMRKEYRPKCGMCRVYVQPRPHGWTCPECGDEILLHRELEDIARPLYTSSEVAEHLGIPERTIRRRIRDGLIEARGKRGNARLYDLPTVEAVLTWGGAA